MKAQNVKIVLILAGLVGLSACSSESIPVTAEDPSKAHAIALVREKQRVIRYNCDNQVTSDKIETIDSPATYIKIKPKAAMGEPYGIATSHFYNQQTRTNAGFIIDSVKFRIHIDERLLDMRVKPGVNQIDYSFSFNDGAVEKGSRYIDVKYSTQLRDGFIEYRPSVEECTRE